MISLIFIITISNVTSIITTSLLTIYIKNKIDKKKKRDQYYKEIFESISFPDEYNKKNNEDFIYDDFLYYEA